MADEALGRLAREERRVAGQHEDRPLAARRARLQDGVAGAEPLALLDDRDALARHRAHAVRVWPDDADEPVREGARRPKRVAEKRTAAERVEHLGRPRAHPLALARADDDAANVLKGRQRHTP